MKQTTTKPKEKKAKPPAKPRKLNPRQQRFAELVASGMVSTQAYMQAGYSQDTRIAEANAYRLLENDGVKAKIAFLRKPQIKAELMSRDYKRVKLKLIVDNPSMPVGDVIRAIAEDSRLAGHYEPDRVEIEAGPNTLQSIKDRAEQIRDELRRKYAFVK